MTYKIGVIGVGFVGTAISECLEFLLQDSIDIREYDKYKNTESINSVVNNSDILFVAVPTPMSDDGSCDTSIVESVVSEINIVSNKSKCIVIKSTIPPGTTESLQKKYPKHTLVFNPEFLTEKRAFEDFLEQDRIILGHTSNKSLFLYADKLFQLFASKQKNPAIIVRVPSEQAEMLKYATNCFLATKLSFFNEMYEICKTIKVDYKSIIDLLKLDKRIGTSHMNVPNSGDYGFGGKCIPKDLNALIQVAKINNLDPIVLDAVWTKNLLVREHYDWDDIPGATTRNMDFKKQ